MRSVAKKDLNHNEIKAILESQGIATHDVHQLKEFCDMTVTFKEITEHVEIKSGKGSLTTGEQKFHDKWPSKVHIIRDEAAAIEFVRFIKNKAKRFWSVSLCVTCKLNNVTCPCPNDSTFACAMYRDS